MLPADGKRFHEISQTHGPNENKISHRESTPTSQAGKRWMANSHKVERRLARGSLTVWV